MKEKVLATNNEAVSLEERRGAKKIINILFQLRKREGGKRGTYAGRFPTSLPL